VWQKRGKVTSRNRVCFKLYQGFISNVIKSRPGDEGLDSSGKEECERYLQELSHTQFMGGGLSRCGPRRYITWPGGWPIQCPRQTKDDRKATLGERVTGQLLGGKGGETQGGHKQKRSRVQKEQRGAWINLRELIRCMFGKTGSLIAEKS